jgi:hypothetical protein
VRQKFRISLNIIGSLPEISDEIQNVYFFHGYRSWFCPLTEQTMKMLRLKIIILSNNELSSAPASYRIAAFYIPAGLQTMIGALVIVNWPEKNRSLEAIYFKMLYPKMSGYCIAST